MSEQKQAKSGPKRLGSRHKQSLFNPALYSALPALTTLIQSAATCDDLERGIFAAGLEDDSAFDSNVTSGSVAGPLTVKLCGNRVDLSRLNGTALAIPQWVESDSLQFVKFSASGILVVEKGGVAQRLMQHNLMSKLNLIIVNSSGFPLVRTRRFLHRLSNETGLPVYLLTDNDTWGYFIFGILKRGMFSPKDTCPYLAADVRFLGLQAGEYLEFGAPERLLVKWKDAWDTRLRHMQKYKCFQNGQWKKEFIAFNRQRAKFELEATLKEGTPDKLTQYIQTKLERRQWLT
jgi:DNA topoisomerase-6 subunit A